MRTRSRPRWPAGKRYLAGVHGLADGLALAGRDGDRRGGGPGPAGTRAVVVVMGTPHVQADTTRASAASDHLNVRT